MEFHTISVEESVEESVEISVEFHTKSVEIKCGILGLRRCGKSARTFNGVRNSLVINKMLGLGYPITAGFGQPGKALFLRESPAAA